MGVENGGHISRQPSKPSMQPSWGSPTRSPLPQQNKLPFRRRLAVMAMPPGGPQTPCELHLSAKEVSWKGTTRLEWVDSLGAPLGCRAEGEGEGAAAHSWRGNSQRRAAAYQRRCSGTCCMQHAACGCCRCRSQMHKPSPAFAGWQSAIEEVTSAYVAYRPSATATTMLHSQTGARERTMMLRICGRRGRRRHGRREPVQCEQPWHSAGDPVLPLCSLLLCRSKRTRGSGMYRFHVRWWTQSASV